MITVGQMRTTTDMAMRQIKKLRKYELEQVSELDGLAIGTTCGMRVCVCVFFSVLYLTYDQFASTG